MLLECINIDKKRNITKIILQRFFKINNNLINLFVETFKFDFDEILDFLRKFLIYKSIDCDINKDDIRYKFSQNIEDITKYKDLTIFNFNEEHIKIFLNSIELINDNLDYYDDTYNGLILYNKCKTITHDSYQDLYNIVVDINNTKLMNKYPKLYDYINVDQHLKLVKTKKEYNCNDYLKKMYHLTIIQFGNMKEYNDNLTFYKYYQVPLLEDIITFINTSDINITKQWFNEIKEDNLDKTKYLNSTNHYLLISPFIKPVSFDIKNLWLTDINTFDYRNIDIHEFFNLWDKHIKIF